MATDKESETKEKVDPWIPLTEDGRQSKIAFQEIKETLANSVINDQSAGYQVSSDILLKLKNKVSNIKRLLWVSLDD